MCDHYIIMSSSYTDGVRVALDVTDSDLICEEHIYGLIAEIKKQCGEDILLSSHLIQTESASWDSVVRYDPFSAACTWHLPYLISSQRFVKAES